MTIGQNAVRSFTSRPLALDSGALLGGLLAGIFLPSEWLIYAFVIAGQAHFFMAYLYQYRGGKMGSSYFLMGGVLLVGAFAYLYFLGEQGVWAFLLVAFLFPIHFALDEVHLHGNTLNTRSAGTVAGFSLLVFATVLIYAFPETELLYAAVAAVFFCGALVRIFLRKETLTRSEVYLWVTGVVVMLLAYFGRPEQALSIIILLHGLNWCIGYGARLKGQGEKEKEYWLLTFITLGVSLLAFIGFTSLAIEPLRYFFLVFYYDLWAIAHVVLSFRFWRA